MNIGVVSGLLRETACFDVIPEAGRAFETAAGVGPRKAEAAAREFAAKGAKGLVSFGIAGGLSPAAPAGSVVLADEVVDGARSSATDDAWSARIRALIGAAAPVVSGRLAGADRMIRTPEDKRRLHDMTDAAACDMESHALARVADEFGIPFVVIRAISDPHDRFAPGWVLKCLTPAGDVRIGPLMGQAIRRPRAWRNLARLASDSGKAFDSLRGVARRLGPGLGFGL